MLGTPDEAAVASGEKTLNAVLPIKKGDGTPRKASPPPPSFEQKQDVEDLRQNQLDELLQASKETHEENVSLRALNASLMASDSGKEIARITAAYESVAGRVNQLTATAAEMKKQLDYQGNVLKSAREALEVEQNSQILTAIKALQALPIPA